MLLATHYNSATPIIIAADADPATRYAAEELQRYVDRLTQVLLPIETDAGEIPSRAVLVGTSVPSRKIFATSSTTGLGHDGYILETSGDFLLILGATSRGTLYGVYDLLERFGVRWWTPREESVPFRTVLETGALRVRVNPPLFYRAIWYRNAMDADWQARMRLSGGSMGPVLLQARHGGMEIYAGQASGHTYAGLVPPAKYFDQHPEYFSEVNGVRLRHTSQLCCTNPAVADIAAETMRSWLRATPEAHIASVTQNDWGNWCTCRDCAALIEREGTPAAPALHLANEVAKRLEKEYPEVLIDIFAYSYTQQPPKHMEAHPNILVRIAPIGNCFGHPIRTCPVNLPCREALAGWSRIARHLFAWHYVTDFFHYMTPFPNLPPLADDLQYYLAHGLKGLFLQGDGNSWGGDMCELKAYLMARLAWDPTLDAKVVRAEFLQGYYRAAAPAVEEYVASFEKTFARTGKTAHLHLYRTLWENDAGYLAKPVLAQARKALERGRHFAKDDPVVLERLDRVEAGLNYTDLFFYERPLVRQQRGQELICRTRPRRVRLMKQLFDTAARSGMSHYGEQYGRYTTLWSLQRAWQASTGRHPVWTLRGGGKQIELCPALGGRIIAYRAKKEGDNILGEGSPKTFGYPCTGGYEEYSQRAHQSPGFAEPFQVVRRSVGGMELRAELEFGLQLVRRIRMQTGDGSVRIATDLCNPRSAAISGCLRAHLEIDLQTPPDQVEFWILRKGTWQQQSGKIGGTWFDDAVFEGWAFWSPSGKRGIWQTWDRSGVGALFLGTIGAEPTVIALDLCHDRDNESIPAGQKQTLNHAFGIVGDKDWLS